MAAVVTGSAGAGFVTLVIALVQLGDWFYGPLFVNDERRVPGRRERMLSYAAPFFGLGVGLLAGSLLIGAATWAVLIGAQSLTAPRRPERRRFDPKSPHFPTRGVALRPALVVADLQRSLAFYRDVLGAMERWCDGSYVALGFQDRIVLLTAGSGPTEAHPTLSLAPPAHGDAVSQAMTITVPDCRAVYELLRERGVQFLTPPVAHDTRCCFRDPDGHLFVMTEGRTLP